LTVLASRPYGARVFRFGWRSRGAAAALLFCASTARATEPTEADKARVATLLRTGAQAAKAKQWEACTEALSAALAIEDAARTAGDLGLCEEQAGRFASAHRHLLHARLTAPPGDKKNEPWKGYQEALARVTERVAIVFISTYPTDARVLLNGRPLGAADGGHVALEPGKHTLAARREGYEDARDERVHTAGSTPHVHLVLARKPQPAEPADLTPSVPATAKRPALAPVLVPTAEVVAPWYEPTWRPSGVLVSIAYASAATAVVSGGVAIGLEVDRASLRAGLGRYACGPASTSRPEDCDRLAERRDQHNAALGVTIGAFVAGGLAAGAARLAFGFERSAGSPTIAPAASTSGGGIVILGKW